MLDEKCNMCDFWNVQSLEVCVPALMLTSFLQTHNDIFSNTRLYLVTQLHFDLTPHTLHFLLTALIMSELPI